MSSHPDWEWVDVGASEHDPDPFAAEAWEHEPAPDDWGQNAWDHDPAPDGPGVDEPCIEGDPGHDEQYWHEQSHADTCGVVSQQFVLEALTGQHFTEDQLAQEAMAHGWYTPGGGTPLDDLGRLIEAHGFGVQHEEGATIADLRDQLGSHEKIIVAVNGEDIWDASHDSGSPLSSFPGIPGQHADHAVEVIGIDDRDPGSEMVILNDPGIPNGQGLEVPLGVFERAWATSGNFDVHTEPTGGAS